VHVYVDIPIVHKGARKDKINAKPFGQPFTVDINSLEPQIVRNKMSYTQFMKPPKANEALFLNSAGVATGSAIITTKQSLKCTLAPE
jgi:hypothetical protein